MKQSNRDYQEFAVRTGLLDRVEPITFELYSEILQRFRLAARGVGPVQPPADRRARGCDRRAPCVARLKTSQCADRVVGSAEPL